MENKIKKFLELSKEFIVTSNEVYEGFSDITTGITYTHSGYGILNGICHNGKQPTKLEQFEKAQLEKIAKVKRYEEYLQLQTDLLEYYTAKEKLNNN